MNDTKVFEDTKKTLGLDASYDVFDTEILLHINSVFSTLTQLGLGPEVGFTVEPDTEWSEFLSEDASFNAVKTYVYLRVRLLFDPPATSFHLDAIQEQIKELEWRLNVVREVRDYVPDVDHTHGLVIDGGEL